MKAKLDKNWSELRTGSILIEDDAGRGIADMVVLSVNASTVNLRNYNSQVHEIASNIVDAINGVKKHDAYQDRRRTLLLQTLRQWLGRLRQLRCW